MQNEMNLDLRLHRTLPYFEDGGHLHVVDSTSKKKSFEIKSLETYFDRDNWEQLTDIQTVGVSPDGRWFLVTKWDEGTEVLEFSTRRDLCVHLWGLVVIEPAALHTLRQLGALQFAPDPDGGCGDEATS